MEDNVKFLRKIWGDEATDKILLAIIKDGQQTMDFKQFLEHCTPCGGNWGGMLLSGIRRLAADVYDAIPDEMGTHAWAGICTVVELMGIKCD